MSKDEKNNILNQHKYLYDGYVTIYNQENNKTPIYVQDLANDKMGLTVNNKGVVKPYGNMGINESHKGLDMIGGDSHDQSEMKYRHLKNGTSDLDNEMFGDDNPSPNEDEFDYISLGTVDDDDKYGNRDLPDFPSTEDYDFKEPFDFEEIDNDETEDGDFGFESSFCKSCEGTGCEECDGSGMKRNQIGLEEDDENYNFSDDLDISSVDEEKQYDVLLRITESLDMFKRFKKYN